MSYAWRRSEKCDAKVNGTGRFIQWSNAPNIIKRLEAQGPIRCYFNLACNSLPRNLRSFKMSNSD